MAKDATPGFLGRGWGFPPSFSTDGAEVRMVEGTDDIHESLRILFATQLGERVMREDFGTNLTAMVFEAIDSTLLGSLRTEITEAILYHETRIRLDQLTITESARTPGLLEISLSYTVVATNSRFNMVYPFYLIEGTFVPQ